MIGWGQILYGALLSALFAVPVLLFVARERRPVVVAAATACAAVLPIAWNAILHSTHSANFFTDAPVAVLPASWQDAGSGVYALAGTALVVGLGLRPWNPRARSR
ncbi:MAG TPA: hypothetical protein VGQ20_00865 [Acidimicrobiales bacterium]|jgi:hypothetical protein|nr:hypothetical protein [Acidimicrobiales bacterium]